MPKITISLSGDHWWDSLTKEQQQAYIAEHPNSKYAKAVKTGTKPKSGKTVPNKTGHLSVADSDRSKWPEHIRVLKLPPAWVNVRYSSDKTADLLAIGDDEKGRKQYVYSESFQKKQSALKFERVLELDKKLNEIEDQNKSNLTSKDAKKKDQAHCLRLIMKMGLRPGGEEDTGADKKAYGATTLEGRHVVVEDGKTYLRFVGKKGVNINLAVEDEDLAKELQRRAKSSKSGKLFPNVDAASLSEYTHTLDGGGFKTKDFRTHLATRTANDIVVNYKPKPRNDKEYKQAVKKVAIAVSKKLGNTPLVALQSYIAPQIFAEWRSSIEK